MSAPGSARVNRAAEAERANLTTTPLGQHLQSSVFDRILGLKFAGVWVKGYHRPLSEPRDRGVRQGSRESAASILTRFISRNEVWLTLTENTS